MNRRMHSVVVLSALYASGQPRNVHRWLLSNRASLRRNRLFFEELFIHLSLLLGFPTMIDGLEKLAKEHPARIQPRTSRKPIHGRVLLRRVYGDQMDKLLSNLGSFHPELPEWVVRDVYGRVYARRGLTLSEREVANVVVLSFQNLEKQMRSHVRGAQRAGVSLARLRKALTLAMRVTGRKRLNGVQLLQPVVSKKKKM